MKNIFLLLILIFVTFSAFPEDENILDPDTPQHLKTDKDRRRRLAVLSVNRDWPRRIQRFIREGEICLDMTEEQLEAAWGKPLQISDAYASIIGQHKLIIFPAGTFSYTIVVMKDDKIIGWSQKVSE